MLSNVEITYKYETESGDGQLANKTLEIVSYSGGESILVIDGEEVVLNGQCHSTSSRELTWDESLILFGTDPLPRNMAEQNKLWAAEETCNATSHEIGDARLEGQTCSRLATNDTSAMISRVFKSNSSFAKALFYIGLRNGSLEKYLNMTDIIEEGVK